MMKRKPLPAFTITITANGEQFVCSCREEAVSLDELAGKAQSILAYLKAGLVPSECHRGVPSGASTKGENTPLLAQIDDGTDDGTTPDQA